MSSNTHDKLVEEYLNYFRQNELWQERRSIRTYYGTQRHLRNIRNLCIQLEKENRAIFQNRPRPRGGTGN